jgi:hypothetical protein
MLSVAPSQVLSDILTLQKAGLIPSAVIVDGAQQLPLAGGAKMPLAVMMGIPTATLDANGVAQRIVLVDHGSDANHLGVLMAVNTDTGVPGVPDNALASMRFQNYLNWPRDVRKINGGGGNPIGATPLYTGPVTLLHFALEGNGPYAVNGTNVLTGSNMVVLAVPSSGASPCTEVSIGDATKGAGSNYRYRTLICTCFNNL